MWTFRRDSPSANGAADGADLTPAMREAGSFRSLGFEIAPLRLIANGGARSLGDRVAAPSGAR
jgi:hypothetical protein